MEYMKVKMGRVDRTKRRLGNKLLGWGYTNDIFLKRCNHSAFAKAP